MMFRAFIRPPAATPPRRPHDLGDSAPRRPRPDRLASLFSAERAGEVGLETLMRVL